MDEKGKRRMNNASDSVESSILKRLSESRHLSRERAILRLVETPEDKIMKKLTESRETKLTEGTKVFAPEAVVPRLVEMNEHLMIMVATFQDMYVEAKRNMANERWADYFSQNGQSLKDLQNELLDIGQSMDSFIRRNKQKILDAANWLNTLQGK